MNAGPMHDPYTGQYVSKDNEDDALKRKARKEADAAEQEDAQESWSRAPRLREALRRRAARQRWAPVAA